MSSLSSLDNILEGNENNLARLLWQRLNPDHWPLPINQFPDGTVLVGGAIRDSLLNRLNEKPDLDFIVPDQAVSFTEQLAKKYNGTLVLLDEERDLARLVINEWSLDFASQSGQNLEEDLLQRDFKINAIALKIGQDPSIIDPLDGIQDLRDMKLRAISEKNLIKDPLRLIRGLRLLAEIPLSIEKKTIDFIRNNAWLLPKAAPERIQAELSKIVVAPFANEAIAFIKDFGLLTFFQNKDDEFSENLPSFDESIALSNSELLRALSLARLTNLLSDDGLKALRFSRKQLHRSRVLRYWKKRDDGQAFRSLTEVDRLRLHKELENDLPALILHFSKSDQEIWLKRWDNLQDPLFHPSSHLDGSTLKKELGANEGPQIGKLINHLCHERAFGRLQNREDALQAARNLWQQKETFL